MGSYTAAPPLIVEIESKSEAIPEPPPPPIQPPIPALFDSRRPPRIPTPEELKRKALWVAFLKQRSSAPVSAGFVRPTGAENNLANEDYTNTFLSHVRLFIFAECYGIAALMTHSLNGLHWTLENFTVHQERVDDVVTLVEYCYENLAPEPLRNLVTLYAACKIDKLWKSDKFCALVEAHSELSMALLGLMVNEL
ncbi:uncharacterized protein Triagg1_7595 [Trichoderma aggressivum f. europaeum]|uniref:Uncharacterized protein n=1 Tax=Trichoderma aggressivum f. europaeum TaxID=173218 RepID=A0AAE1J227_9HYPO|nr:hypothetical protein Triagg1_7595 [Trichoderma aggressivum f. europaeum]